MDLILFSYTMAYDQCNSIDFIGVTTNLHLCNRAESGPVLIAFPETLSNSDISNVREIE